ncbi:MAG: apolipoprotein N-acyltransferase [Ruminococcaceae bacterium]|nr:apolipoprotein N-acyltransferase [Oscillospiraceae bacterium]
MKIKFGFAESLNKILDRKGLLFLTLLASAVLTALTLIFEIMSVLVFVSLAPLVIILVKRCENVKKAFSSYGVGFVWSFFFYIVIYHWFWYLWPMDFLGVEKPLALLITLFCWIGLSLLQTIGTAFVAPLFCIAFKKGGLRMAPFVFASAWTVLEYVQSLTWMGVPWARLALSQTAFPAAVQSASLFGSLFIGFIIALVNGFVAVSVIYFTSKDKASKRAVRVACAALAVVMLNLGYGFLAIGLHNEKKGEEVTVTVIQGNISSNDKWADQSNSNAMKVYRNLTLAADAKKHADIVVWPETIITTYARTSPFYRNDIKELAKETGSIIFVGTIDKLDASEDITYEYNAVVAFFPDGTIEEGSYKKQHLVPFGEYMPMRDILTVVLPFMTELNMLEDDLTPGTNSELLETEFGNIGRLICFDSIYPDLARESAADGAEYILLSTNDSWYRDSASAYQHNSHAVLRAVENRRYIARAASTGISAIISSDGEVIDMLDPLVKGYVTASVHRNTQRTLYSYVGDIIVLPCVIFIVTLVCIDVIEHKRKNNKSSI